MDFEQKSIEEQIAALDLLELTPEEREFATGCIEQGPEALEWAEAALAVLPPIDDGEIPPGVLDDLGGTALCGQVITFSKKRLLRFVGRMPENYMAQIDDALRQHFG